MNEFDVNNVSQSAIAEFFGVDRTTVRAWQKKGLPHINNGKGKSLTFVGPLAVRWRIGQKAGLEYKIDTSDPLTSICFGYAVDYYSSDEFTWTHESLLSDLQKCLDVTPEKFHQTFGYCLAIARDRQGLPC